jgi:hypothetical protein
MFRAPIWQRPHFAPGGGAARFGFLVFSPSPFPTPDDGTMPMDFTDWCPTEAWPHGLTWGYRTREKSPEMFARMEAGAEQAAGAPGLGVTPGVLSELRRAQFGAQVACDVADPPDLGHLQFAWAIVRWLLGSGATAVLDADAGRWFGREEILGWHKAGWPDGRKFALEREVAFSTLPLTGSAHWAIQTHGMTKFGRPDLLSIFASQGEADLNAEVRRASLPGYAHDAMQWFATRLALGELVRPGDALKYGAVSFAVEACAPGQNVPIEANPEALVLVDPSAHYRAGP